MNKNFKDNKTLISIPAFNKADSIKGVVECIKKEAPYADILVVDDGSSDSSRDIIKTLDILVINHPYNMSYGVVLKLV